MNKRTLFFLLLILFSLTMLASAGGGGGGHSGGGGGDGGGIFYIVYLIFRLIFMLPFPLNLIVLGLVIFGIYYASRKYKNISGLNDLPNYNPGMNSFVAKTDNIPADFLQRNPDFTAENFKGKVRTAFTQIQDAWMLQDLSAVRKWISDGVYQRFNTQFIMMKQIDQTNEISNIQIQQIFLDAIESDGNYDIIHAGIQYSMYDGFASNKFPQLNDGGPLQAIEFWSFVKKSGVKEKDLYHTTNCPNCGGDLPKDGGETAKCPYCSTITYLGDYDWILSEITQPDDYYNSNSKYEKQGKFSKRIREQIGEQKDFSLQMLEDKASNGYMQMMTALVLKKPEAARRFVSDKLFDKLEQKIKTEQPSVFFRLYLNHVTAFDYYKEGGKDNIVVALKRSLQRIINPATNPSFDRSIISQNEIMIMSRDEGAGKPKGALYAHSCPNCGAPVKDTIDLKCSYCGEQLNSTRFEWIVSDWMTANEYEAFKNTSPASFAIDKNVDELDDLFKVRDYALNNVLMMVAADGRITGDEEAYINSLAKKWNYDVDKIQGFLMMAKSNKLVVRLPQDTKDRQKIIALMEKAASLDNAVTAEEKALLEQVRNMA